MTIEEVECPVCHVLFPLDDFDPEKYDDLEIECPECGAALGVEEYAPDTKLLMLVELEDEEDEDGEDEDGDKDEIDPETIED